MERHATFGSALYDAEQIIESFPDWSIYRVTGTSMYPLLKDGHLVICQPASLEDVDIGMLVLYRDPEGDPVVHQVVAKAESSARTKGFRNFTSDPDPVTDGNLLGVVAAVFPAARGPEETVYLGSGEKLRVVYGKRR